MGSHATRELVGLYGSEPSLCSRDLVPPCPWPLGDRADWFATKFPKGCFFVVARFLGWPLGCWALNLAIYTSVEIVVC